MCLRRKSRGISVYSSRMASFSKYFYSDGIIFDSVRTTDRTWLVLSTVVNHRFTAVNYLADGPKSLKVAKKVQKCIQNLLQNKLTREIAQLGESQHKNGLCLRIQGKSGPILEQKDLWNKKDQNLKSKGIINLIICLDCVLHAFAYSQNSVIYQMYFRQRFMVFVFKFSKLFSYLFWQHVHFKALFTTLTV